MSKAAPVETIMKHCIDCNVTKPASAFFSTAATPDRLTRRCRDCVLAEGRRATAERDARNRLTR
jgi:hypothetical protein